MLSLSDLKTRFTEKTNMPAKKAYLTLPRLEAGGVSISKANISRVRTQWIYFPELFSSYRRCQKSCSESEENFWGWKYKNNSRKYRRFPGKYSSPFL